MVRSRSNTRKEGPRLRDLARGIHWGGKIGEIWAEGQRVGLVYSWEFAGSSGEWRVDAERYRLDFLPGGCRDIELRLDMRIGTLTAKGLIWTDPVVDGHSHRAIVIKGRTVEWTKQEPVVPTRCT